MLKNIVDRKKRKIKTLRNRDLKQEIELYYLFHKFVSEFFFVLHLNILIFVVSILFCVVGFVHSHSVKHLCRHGQEYELQYIFGQAARIWHSSYKSNRFGSISAKYRGIWPKIIATMADEYRQRNSNEEEFETKR